MLKKAFLIGIVALACLALPALAQEPTTTGGVGERRALGRPLGGVPARDRGRGGRDGAGPGHVLGGRGHVAQSRGGRARSGS